MSGHVNKEVEQMKRTNEKRLKKSCGNLVWTLKNAGSVAFGLKNEIGREANKVEKTYSLILFINVKHVVSLAR